MDKYDTLKLDHQLCFPLYAAAREVVKRYHPYLEALDLTYTQYIAMMIIWEYGSCSVKEAGERLHLDSGTLTPVLKSLEAKGFVCRRRSTSDERVVNVEITEKGAELRERALQIPLQMAGCIGLDPEESAQLYHLLYKLLGEER